MSQNGNGKVKSERPNTEVVSRAERRTYTYEYKQRIMQEIDQSRQAGEVGAILRREGGISPSLPVSGREGAGG